MWGFDVDSNFYFTIIGVDIFKHRHTMNNVIRILIVTALAALSSVAVRAQSVIGGSRIVPLDKETVIVDLSSPAGSGNLFVNLDVDYPDGSDSTFFFVTSSQEAVYEAAGIKPSEQTGTIQFTYVDYIRSCFGHFIARFPKVDLWLCLSAEKSKSRCV